MAILAIGAIGAVAGAGVGAAAGLATFSAIATAATVGFSLATMVGNVLFPQQTTQEGSRLGDLNVTSSAFGAVRPIGYGKIRIAGNVIWAVPIREQKTTTKSGGKGGPSVSSTTYTYFGTFALALCEGVVDKVVRIWADSKLVYDATSGSDTLQRPGFRFRFYPGNETQLPDSLIEKDKGVGNVPGYRGTCYLVFDDIPLADYGNRIPNVTVELTFSSTPDYGYDPLIRASPSIFGGVAPYSAAIDTTRQLGYLLGTSPNGIIEFDPATMQTIREVPMTAILADGTTGGSLVGLGGQSLFVGPDGALYFYVAATDPMLPGSKIVRVDPYTMKETASYPAPVTALGGIHDPGAFATFFASLSRLDMTAGQIDYLVVLGYYGGWALLGPLPALTLGSNGALTGSVGLARAFGVVGGVIEVGAGDAWALSADSTAFAIATHIYVDRISIGRAVDLLGSPAGGSLTNMAALTPTQIDPAAVAFYANSAPSGLSYDAADNSLLFQVETLSSTSPVTASGTFLVKWSPDSGVLFSQKIANSADGWAAQPAIDIGGGTYAKAYAGRLLMIDSASGAITLDQTMAPTAGAWPIGNFSARAQIYDGNHQALYSFVDTGFGAPEFFAKIRLGRLAGASTTLAAIVSDQCKRAGFADADFDVTPLTDVLEGFVVSQRATVIDVLTPLIGAYLVDAVETDYILKFRHRGGAADATLVEDDLIRVSQNTAEPYTETRQQEIELPMRVTLTYIDADRDFQANTQAAKRARNPDPCVFSDNQSDINLAVVTTATPAKQMAEMLLYTAWAERHSFAVRLPPRYAYLDPADVVTLTLADGYTARTRLGPTALGVDYSLDTKLIGESDGQYVSTAAAAAGVPWAQSHTISDFGPSQMILLDVPLLRDIDDLGGAAIRAYWGGSAFLVGSTWPGTILQQSPDVANWTSLDATSAEATWGYLATPPADTTAIFAVQYDGSLVVGVVGGDFVPSSVTDLELANGANPLALLKTNGEVEVVQYRDAAAQGGNRYLLSTLRRGQRGTDSMASGHSAGETVVFLDPATIGALDIPLAQRNVVEFYRAVTNGTLAQSASTKPFTFHARDLMPYAPVNFARAPSGSDLVVTWTRRTRIGGWQLDGIDTVPLNETAEAYEAYVIASAGALASFDPTNAGTYVRAFTGLASPTLTYTAAQMSADSFTAATDTLYLVVYQLSSVVGRGFPGYQALPAF